MGQTEGNDVVALTISYDTVGYTPAVEPRSVKVAGPSDELFELALLRTLGEPPNGARFHVVVPDFDGHSGYWLGAIDEHVSLGDMARFADGDVIHIDLGGRGGGALPLLWDVIGAVSTLAWLVQLGLGANAHIQAARVRNVRIAAREWVDAGIDTEPPMALRQYVFDERHWVRREFDRRFALDRASGSALLRAVGYTKTALDPETWSEPY